MLPPSRFVETFQDEAPAEDAGLPEPGRPSGVLSWAITLCLAVVLVAFGATTYLSRALDAGAQRQREAHAAILDPETTGSIAGAAARTLFEPCTAAGLRR